MAHSVRSWWGNFGVMFSWWDRLLGTYRAEPERGHEGMNLGLEYFRDPSENRLISMLTQPLRQPAARERVADTQPVLE